MLILPEEHRGCFRRPFGTLYPSADVLLPALAGRPVYAVGDVVTHNLIRLGVVPHIAILDGHTMRIPCNRSPLLRPDRVTVKNPAGTLTDELMDAIVYAVAHPPAVIFVDGEEDLAVIPVVIAAPMGAAVLYGQPKEGIVMRIVDEEAKSEAERLLSLFVEE
jgi:GTP-dependent dephospho-CoA kinase